jgi:hypothetical protein
MTFKITENEGRIEALIDGSLIDIIGGIGAACLEDERVMEILEATLQFVKRYKFENTNIN